MPSCFCTHARCNGAIIGQKAFENHQRHDKQQRACEALSAANQVCQDEDEQIAAYIASLTLSDDATGDLTGSGGRLWSRSSSSTLPSSTPSLSTPHMPVSKALDQLHDIERALEDLHSTVEPRLNTLEKPSSRADLFPLKAELSQSLALQNRLSAITSKVPSVRETKGPIHGRLLAFLSKLRDAQTEWNKHLKLLPEETSTFPTFDTGHLFEPILPGVNPIVQASVFMMVALQTILHVSRRGCQFILAMLRYIVQLSLMHKNCNISAMDEALLTNFPVDPHTATSAFRLDGRETVYAVCPNSKCHKTYAPIFIGRSPIPNYPTYCSHKEFDDGVECGTRLTQHRSFGKKDVEVPIKRFVAFSFKNFVAELLSRPGIEDKMDAPSISNGDEEVMTDIFHGQFLRTFTGPDGLPFRSNQQAGRYSFSLCVDFFNPFTNKQAGKKCSIGLISIVCISLPASMRYKPENMFLAGVVPGPNEPPLTALNHYLTPLVDELSTFWEPGVLFSQTFNFPEGRLVLCALVLVICDLLAARKTAGFAACNHEHFCSVCKCTRSRDGFATTDYHNWNRRTNAECRNNADKYRHAGTLEARTRSFDQTGVRWSELLRLSYFDIARCVVVDSMHNLFLGLIKEHFTGILGIGLSKFQEKPVISLTFEASPPDMASQNKKGIEKLKRILEAPVAIMLPNEIDGVKKLKSVNLPVLKFVAGQVKCQLPNKDKFSKADYAKILYDWRVKQKEVHATGVDTSTSSGHVLNVDEVLQIWADIECLVSPSWMTSVPSKLGTASHGKLKADQWRALGTIFLPLSLIRLWGITESSEPRSSRCRQILDLTISLASAVIIATSHSITTAHAEAYLQYMLQYLNGMKELFPEYNLHPNHHMALHIHEFLLLFGPVHSWWTFPFERMIGALQRMPHNDKIGELEESIARAYTRSANLRAILHKSNCPEVIRHSETMFRKLIDPQLRDTLTVDIRMLSALVQELPEDGETQEAKVNTSLEPLPRDLKKAFTLAGINVPANGQLLANLSFKGVTYSTSTKHFGNSCILISPAHDLDGEPVPAQITYLIQFFNTDTPMTYFGVRRHKAAAVLHDPYSRYPDIRAQLWDAQLEDLEIFLPSQVIAHFACLPLEVEQKKLVVVLSLSRVSLAQAL